VQGKSAQKVKQNEGKMQGTDHPGGPPRRGPGHHTPLFRSSAV